MSALIVGGGSLIGGALFRFLEAKGVAVTTTTRRVLDLAAPPASWPALPAVEVAYLCAAVSKLEVCEADPRGTWQVNVDGTVELARRLRLSGAFVVFLSSNQVFDGSEPHRRFDSTPCPINEYGRQKAAAERRLAGAAILRLTKVVPFPLLERWRETLGRGEPIEAFEDLVVAPLELATVLDALAHIGRRGEPGIYQISGPRDVSYYDLAGELAASLGVDPTLVRRARAPAGYLPRHTTLMPHLPGSTPLPLGP